MDAAYVDHPAPELTKICKSGKCSRKPQPIENFTLRIKDSQNGKRNEFTDVCKKCMEKDRERKRKKRGIESDDGTKKWEQCDMDTFLACINNSRENDIDLRVYINTEEYIPVELESKERAKGLALFLDDIMGLHWTYGTNYIGRSFTQWSFNCAQSIMHDTYRPKPEPLRRRRIRMDRAECNGRLHITIKDHDPFMKIYIRHKCSHSPYKKKEQCTIPSTNGRHATGDNAVDNQPLVWDNPLVNVSDIGCPY